jgi:crotonobetainyl-CoA:carnitine CoA-transferase CaiB-like acyl-CoA transferase
VVPFADGSSLTVNSPIWIRGQDKAKPRRPPNVGEHTDEVLREAGYSDTEIGTLRAEGVVG